MNASDMLHIAFSCMTPNDKSFSLCSPLRKPCPSLQYRLEKKQDPKIYLPIRWSPFCQTNSSLESTSVKYEIEKAIGLLSSFFSMESSQGGLPEYAYPYRSPAGKALESINHGENTMLS